MKPIFFYTIFLLMILSGSFVPFFAESQLQTDVEYRPRFEFRDGYRELLSDGATPSFIVSHRMRLTVSYQTEGLRLIFAPQDVRVWGDEQLSSSTGVFGDDASFDLYEGYTEIKLGADIWISVGRQALSYGNQRLLSARNWNQNGLSYDAVVLKTKAGKWNIHSGASWNSLSATTSDNFYLPERIKSLNFLWLKRGLGSNFDISLNHIASGVTETDSANVMHFRHTSGIYADYGDEMVSFKGNVYYQYGKNSEGIDVSAFLMDADVSLDLGKFAFGAGFSYLSGNSDATPSTDHLFDLLYGARHRYFGHMDYFRNMSSHTGGGGLSDWFSYLGYKISDNITLKNTSHFFSLASTNENTPDDKALGFENEVELKYKFCQWGTLKAAWLFYIPTDSFRELQGIDEEKFPHFAFIELTLKPAFNRSLDF